MKTRTATLALSLWMLAACLATATLGQSVGAHSVQPGQEFDRKVFANQRRQDVQLLLLEEGGIQLPGIELQLDAAQQKSLAEPAARSGVLKVGVSHQVTERVAFDETKADGAGLFVRDRGAVRIDDQSFTWFTRIRSKAIRETTDSALPLNRAPRATETATTWTNVKGA